MAKIAPKPIFCVVLSNGQQWAVEAEWPDGTIEQIDTFKAHLARIMQRVDRCAAQNVAFG